MRRKSEESLCLIERAIVVSFMITAATGESIIESRAQHVAAIVGDDVILRCSLASLEPDTPPILWTRNKMLLTNSRLVLIPDASRIEVSGTDGGLSFDLILRQVSLTDEGEYTCQLAGSHGSRVIHRLTVNIPPTIEEFYPLNPFLDVLSGEDLKMECTARGKPEPTISWRKLNEEREKIYEVREMIELKSVDRSHNGTYSCTADNGFGRNVTHLFHVNVEYIPAITVSTNALDLIESQNIEHKDQALDNMPHYQLNNDQRHHNQHLSDLRRQQFHFRYASMLIVNCSVSANPSAHVTWFHNGTRLADDDDGKMIRTTATVTGIEVSTLTVGLVTENDVGVYRCVADNRVGSTYHEITIRGEPYDLHISSEPLSVYSDQYVLQWSFKSASPVQHFHVRLTQAIVKNSTTNETKGEPMLEIKQMKYTIKPKNERSNRVDQSNESLLQTFSHVIDNLDAGSKYSVSVQVVNSFGPSEWSKEFRFTMVSAGNPAPRSTTLATHLPRHHFLRDASNGSIAQRRIDYIYISLLLVITFQLASTSTLF